VKSMGLEKCGLTSWGDSETKDFLSRRHSDCIHGVYPICRGEGIVWHGAGYCRDWQAPGKPRYFLLWIQKNNTTWTIPAHLDDYRVKKFFLAVRGRIGESGLSVRGTSPMWGKD
jgi:hypothetical protein